MAVSIMAFPLLGSRLLPGPSAPSAGKPKGTRRARLRRGSARWRARHRYDAHRIAVAPQITLQVLQQRPGIQSIGLLMLAALVLQWSWGHHIFDRCAFGQFPVIPVPTRSRLVAAGVAACRLMSSRYS